MLANTVLALPTIFKTELALEKPITLADFGGSDWKTILFVGWIKAKAQLLLPDPNSEINFSVEGQPGQPVVIFGATSFLSDNCSASNIWVWFGVAYGPDTDGTVKRIGMIRDGSNNMEIHITGCNPLNPKLKSKFL